MAAPSANWDALLTGISRGKTVAEFEAQRAIFMQGQPADAVYFVRAGKVRLSVTSADGKEAIVATLGAGEFFGEGCLAGQLLRMATATAASDCTLIKVERTAMARTLASCSWSSVRLFASSRPLCAR